jgi:hypothetical protein
MAGKTESVSKEKKDVKEKQMEVWEQKNKIANKNA